MSDVERQLDDFIHTFRINTPDGYEYKKLIELDEAQSYYKAQLDKAVFEAGKIGGKTVKFDHTAVNKDAHLFIDGVHDPDLCPECIRPGTLRFEKG